MQSPPSLVGVCHELPPAVVSNTGCANHSQTGRLGRDPPPPPASSLVPSHPTSSTGQCLTLSIN